MTGLIIDAICVFVCAITAFVFATFQPLGEKIHKKLLGFKPFNCYICLPIWATATYLVFNNLQALFGFLTFGAIYFGSKKLYEWLP